MRGPAIFLDLDLAAATARATEEKKLLLVDFTAAWCGPCKQISPILDELSVEQADKLQIAKIDVDENPATTLRYDVMSMPTLILFKDGEPQRKLIGARGKQHLLNELAEVL